MEKYYELKQRYEKGVDARKRKIKKNQDLTLKEKRAMIKKIVPRCVNCNKPGGTVFEEKNGMLKAVCANKTPCDLNINIKRIRYDNVRDFEIKNDKLIENLKMRIIMTKLDYLFGVNKSKDEIVDKFNTLKAELAVLSEKQLIITTHYGDIISGMNRNPLLNDANLDLAIEIDELKKIDKEYNDDEQTSYLKTMVEKYLTKIMPLTEQIKKIKYGYYALEHSEFNGGDDNDKIEETLLVANPYRFEQLEREQK